MKKALIVPILAMPLLAACDDPTGLDGEVVSVRFATSSGATAASAALLSSHATGPTLVVAGSNGTLTLTKVAFIVERVKLGCEDDDTVGTAPACVEFKSPPTFLELPLGNGVVEVASTTVPAGIYDELEFEVEDLEIDGDEDATSRQQILDLLAAIRTTHGFSDFPDRASMVVEGTFTPAGSTTAEPFRTYFEAEIEVELDLVPPLTVSEAGASRTLTVDVQPALWFRGADGQVLDLSAFDFSSTGQLVEFEVELERGFVEIEIDD